MRQSTTRFHFEFLRQHRLLLFFIIVTLLLSLPLKPSAHEVPAEITVRAFLKPHDQQLQMVIRVPLSGLLNSKLPKEGPGYLALDYVDKPLRETALEVAAAIDLYEEDTLLAPPTVTSVRISLPLDESFKSYESAIAHVMGPPLPSSTEVFWQQGFADAILEYSIQSARSRFSMHANLTPLAPMVTTAFEFISPAGTTRAFSFLNDVGRIWFEPHWYQVTASFFSSGFLNVAKNLDQWLFVLCLIVAVRQTAPLFASMAAFAAGQAGAIVAVRIGGTPPAVWLLSALATLLTVVIIYIALENIVTTNLRRRWMIVLGFGFLAGTAFAGALETARQFSGDYRGVSAIAFSIGADVGQWAIAAALTLPFLVLTRMIRDARMRTVILSGIVANVAWQRVLAHAREFNGTEWPVLEPGIVVTALSWLLAMVVATGAIWFVKDVLLDGRSGNGKRGERPEAVEAGKL